MNQRTATLLALLLLATPLSWAAQSEYNEVFDNVPNTSVTTATDKTPSKNKTFEGTWNIVLQAESGKDDTTQKNVFGFSLNGDLNYHLFDTLKINFAPEVTQQSGYVQTLDQDRYNNSMLLIKNAVLDWTPVKQFELTAGALNESTVHSNLLVTEQAFPAIKIDLHFKPFNIFAQSAIPTSSSLSTETQSFEPTPQFQSFGVYLKMNNKKNNNSLLLQGSYFQYSNLPATVAYYSGLAGNSVTGTNGTNSAFVSQFAGYEAKAQMVLGLTKYVGVDISAAYLINTKAEGDVNSGYDLTTKLPISISDKISIAPIYEYFNINPDAAVAYYSEYGTNQIGYNAGVELGFYKTIKVKAVAGERVDAYESAVQSGERLYLLSLETFNAPI